MPHIVGHEEVTITDEVGQLVNAPSLPAGTLVNPVLQEIQPDELLQDAPLVNETGNVVATPTIDATGVVQGPDQVVAPELETDINIEAPEVNTQFDVGTDVPQVSAPTGLTDLEAQSAEAFDAASVEAQQYTASLLSDAQIEAGLVSTALGELLDFEAGDVPDIFKGAVLEATAQANARGLGSSTIAAEAIAAGLVNAALPIAQGDSAVRMNGMLSNQAAENVARQFNATSRNQVRQFYDSLASQIDMFNAGEQNRITLQTALTNAQLTQNAEITNAQNALAAATTEAELAAAGQRLEAELQLQANTTATTLEQESARLQATMILDAAKFTEGLTQEARIATATNELDRAVTQATLEAEISQFNSTRADARQEFNIANQLIIDQSNTVWRRQINTENTAAINAANQANAANLLSLSNFALSAMWQEYRDEAYWAWTSSENVDDRAHNLAIAAFNRKTLFDQMDAETEAAFYQQLGSFAINLLGAITNDDEEED